jgi:membrane protease YdiL (CAAX protease family)
MPDAKDSAGLHPRPAGESPARLPLVPLALAFYGVLLAAAVGWRMWADGVGPWRADQAAPLWPLPARLAAGPGTGALLVAASRLWTAHSTAGRRLSDELAAALGPIATWQGLVLAGASGLAEEAFFRGALQPRVGWPLATLAFGLAHFHPRPSLRLWSASALIAGLAFAALFAWSGDLVAPVLAHATVNAVNLRWLAERARDLRREM